VDLAHDHRLAARATVALALANVRYWLTVAPRVRRQLRHWEGRAQAIHDPDLRALALGKLHTEGFNAEAGAMLATLAPRAHRKQAVDAIVALELLFDYLDGRTESPLGDPLRDGERLYTAFTDAIEPAAERPRHSHQGGQDASYLEELSTAVSVALEQLPARQAIMQAARASAQRSATAQVHMHTAPEIGTTQLEDWARSEAQQTGLDWREFLAGAASSVLALHALIAAAADPRTTPTQALQIDAAYLSICVVVTLLDGVVDQGPDGNAGELGYISFYDDPDLLGQTLAGAAQRAAREARALRNGTQHVMMLAGAVAFWASAPGARSDLARPVVARLRRALGPLVSPPLAVMRIWRAVRSRGAPEQPRTGARRRVYT
jgi:tetraprenyl-beta-curcumene synthase